MPDQHFFDIALYQPPAAREAGAEKTEEAPYDTISVQYGALTLKSTIADLRLLLQADRVIDSTDVFRVHATKAAIPKAQEKTRNITAVCKTEQSDDEKRKEIYHHSIAVVRYKADDVIIPSPADLPKAPEIKPDPLKPDEQDHVSQRTGRGTDGVASGEDVIFAALSDQDKAQLFAQTNVFRGVLFKDGQLSWSFLQPLEGGATPWERVIARTPQETYINNEFFTYDKTEARFRQCASGSLSGGFKAFGFGVAAELSGGWARETSTSASTMYGYSETLVPKIEFRLHPDKVGDLTEGFRAALDGFRNVTGTSFEDYERLRRCIEEWGAYIPLEFMVGGKLFSTDTVTVTTAAEAYKWQVEFKMAAKAACSSLNVAAQYSQDGAEAETHQAKTAFLQAVGGDPGQAIAPPNWVASLSAVSRWRTCRITRLVPIYEFTPDEQIKTGIYRTLSCWAEYWREDPVMLSYDDYVMPLERYGLLKWPNTPPPKQLTLGTPGKPLKNAAAKTKAKRAAADKPAKKLLKKVNRAVRSAARH